MYNEECALTFISVPCGTLHEESKRLLAVLIGTDKKSLERLFRNIESAANIFRFKRSVWTDRAPTYTLYDRFDCLRSRIRKREETINTYTHTYIHLYLHLCISREKCTTHLPRVTGVERLARPFAEERAESRATRDVFACAHVWTSGCRTADLDLRNRWHPFAIRLILRLLFYRILYTHTHTHTWEERIFY